MVNHYEILGLSYGAGIAEVKASFRQLAKLYHPDKNPEGIEHFARILKAYEVLSDPVTKASYDYKLNYHQAQVQQGRAVSDNKPGTKTWKFDEREMKRRQYYNEHIKKYAKQTSDYMAEAETKKNYNEFKYILLATPLAVILFLLIMNLATRDREEVIATTTSPVPTVTTAPAPEQTVELKQEMPYTHVFGPARYSTINAKTLSVENRSGEDLIICLFHKNNFIRSLYLSENKTGEISQLPAEALSIYYCSGTDFDASRQLAQSNVKGAFIKDPAFYKSQKPRVLNEHSALKLLPGINPGFELISEKEFFKYVNKL